MDCRVKPGNDEVRSPPPLGPRHCEERTRRSNPESRASLLDCFADARNDASPFLVTTGHSRRCWLCGTARCAAARVVTARKPSGALGGSRADPDPHAMIGCAAAPVSTRDPTQRRRRP
jgi:hypothetical protein